MTTKDNQTTKKRDTVTIPTLTVKKAHRVLLSSVRMPAELVAQAYTIMNRENWTPTEFTEKAWRMLIESTKTK